MRHLLAQFLAMGGYAAFVWPAYGASLLGLGAAIGLTLRAYARAKASLATLERER
jgi:heme exporter protein D